LAARAMSSFPAPGISPTWTGRRSSPKRSAISSPPADKRKPVIDLAQIGGRVGYAFSVGYASPGAVLLPLQTLGQATIPPAKAWHLAAAPSPLPKGRKRPAI